MADFPLSQPDGRTALGCTLGFGSTFSSQILSRVGYDFVMIDMEHHPLSAREAGVLVHVVMAASAGKCQPLVRIPSHGPEWIKWALDAGAVGIIVPMVESRAQMENIVQSALYPPRGARSFGPALALFADLDPAATTDKYLNHTSNRIALIPMIESVQGLNNIEKIASVDGVTSVFVGPVDLRLSMGLPGSDGTESVYLEALQKILATCSRLGKPVGIFARDGESCKCRTLEGFNFLLLPGEAALLAQGAKANLEDCKNGTMAAQQTQTQTSS
ncbi:hypothetical protein CLAIMM_00115 [Cladophialophora immunda]|nr:hypothetical protein CLAIMM_00115 [Cladophialophora immunda]